VDEVTTGSESGESGEGVSRRRALEYGGLATAGLLASQLATSSASAAEGGRSVPMRTISLAQAERVVRAAVRYVNRTPGIPPMYILVVDSCGDEKASARMDGNGAASTDLVPVKAHTSRSFRAPTAELAGRTTDPARIASFTTAGFSLLGGGRPIVEGDELIGAIGVGGGSPEQDDEVAVAALRAL
jgi:glc operon protein GlcG